jgi:hypothetical protein
MSEVKLFPNDRVMIGPSALFLYKNTEHEDEASRPDTVENPTDFDFADAEVQDAIEIEDAGALSKE